MILMTGCGGSSGTSELPIQDNPDEEVPSIIETFTIDIKTANYSGTLLLNGMFFDSATTDGQFFLNDSDESSELIRLGSFFNQTFEKKLIQKDYHVEYFYQFGGGVPSNFPITVKDNFELNEALFDNLNIDSISVGFDVTLNEDIFPLDQSNEAEFYLKPLKEGSLIYLGSSTEKIQSVLVAPGDYQIVYHYISGSSIPVNTDFTLSKIYSVSESMTLAININSSSSRVIFNSENSDVVFDSDNTAHFLLKSKSAESYVDLGSTEQEFSSIQLIVGEYELLYDYRSGDQIPINKKKIIDQISVNENQPVIQPIVKMIILNGDFYHNDKVVSSSGLNYANLYLQESSKSEFYFISATHELSYEDLRIVPGEYNILYDFREGFELPQNSQATMIYSQSLTSTGTFDIDIISVETTANVTLNGNAFPESGLSFGNISLLRDGDRRIELGASHSPLKTVIVLSGEYNLFYDAREVTNVPYNTDFRVEQTINITVDGTFNYDFKAKTIRIETLVNGVAAPLSGLEYGRLSLEGNGEAISIGRTNESVERMVMLGDYDVFYEFRETQGVMPTNFYSKVSEIRIE